VRTHFETKEKIYLTEDELKKYEAEADTYYIGKENLRKVTSYGITDSEIDRVRQELAVKFGRQPSTSDVVWGAYCKKTSQLVDRRPIPNHEIGMIYYAKGLVLDSEGKDCYEQLKESGRFQLLEYKNNGIRKVSILAKKSCLHCSQLAGKIYDIEDALKNSPLPVKDCKTKLSKKSKGFCRCLYLPVISQGVSG